MKKGYKVTDVKRKKRFGVAAGNLAELIEKSCVKLGFNVSCAECQLYVAEDGTVVDDDDYLGTLPPQTLLILLRKDEDMVTDFDYFYSLVRSHKQDYIDTGEKAKSFLSDNFQEKFKVFQKYLDQVDDAHVMISEREKDPEWFEGLVSSEKTKEQSMSKRAKERMLKYYYKTTTALRKSELYIHSKDGRGKKLIDEFLVNLRKLLETSKFNTTYFNRKAAEDMRMCDNRGLFRCKGLWNQENCNYGDEHVINPYGSREARILFQTWNLDHRVELSRSVIPKILEAIHGLYSREIKCITCRKTTKSGDIEVDRYYLQIFTQDNLKLVHCVCHSKVKHDAHSGVYTLCKSCNDENID